MVGEQKRMLDNLARPTKFFTTNNLKKGQLEEYWKQRVKIIIKINLPTAKAYKMREG